MRWLALKNAIAIGSLVATHCATAAGEPWRVVVQAARLSAIAVSPGGTLLAATSGKYADIFHVVDARDARILLTRRFPERVSFAAVAGDRDRVFVATERGVALVSLGSGTCDEVIPDMSGTLAFEDERKLLGILGRVTRPTPADPFEAMILGLYDVGAKRWLVRTRTPICARAALAFDGDELVADGVDGTFFNRVQTNMGHHVVRVDLKTGAVVARMGVIGRDGDEYPRVAVPAAITRAEVQLRSAAWRFDQLRAKSSRLSPGEVSSEPSAGIGGDDGAQFVLRGRDAGGTQAAAAILTIGDDGAIAIGTARTTDGLPARVVGGRLLATRFEKGGTASVIDLGTGEVLATLPESPSGTSHELPAAAGDGYLFYEAGRLSYLPLGRNGPVVLADPGDGRFDDLTLRRLRPGSSVLGLVSRAGDALFVYRLDTGLEVATIPFPKGPVPTFNASGTRVLVESGGPDVRVYELPSARPVRAVPEATMEPYRYLPLGTGWLACGHGGSRLLDAEGRWGQELAVGDVTRAELFATPGGYRLLLESSLGNNGSVLANAATGALLCRWLPTGAFSAFGGKILVRSLQWSGAVELVSLENLEPVATIHPVVHNHVLGWVAFTPDGFWDASPGAEEFVAVFPAAELADPGAAATRHAPAQVRARIASAASK